jgi:hypothetical protein
VLDKEPKVDLCRNEGHYFRDVPLLARECVIDEPLKRFVAGGVETEAMSFDRVEEHGVEREYDAVSIAFLLSRSRSVGSGCEVQSYEG